MKKTALLLLPVIILVSCAATFAGDTNELWIVLLDLSGSMGAGKDTPYQKNMEKLYRIINSAGKGTTIIVTGFGRRADARLLKVEIPKIAGPRQVNLVATRAAAIKKLNENIAAKADTIDRSRTDIHGALLRSARLFMEADGRSQAKKRLFILSDMIENENFNLNLRRLAANGPDGVMRDMTNKKLKYPDMKGIEIYCYSAFSDNSSDMRGMKTSEIEMGIQNLRAFWTAYFKKTGGVLKSYKTGMY